MEIPQALSQLQECNGTPMLRRCYGCEVWLDEASEAVANARIAIEHVVSHGLCPPCADKEEAKLDKIIGKK